MNKRNMFLSLIVAIMLLPVPAFAGNRSGYMTSDQKAALDGANAPSATNVLATADDVAAVETGVQTITPGANMSNSGTEADPILDVNVNDSSTSDTEPWSAAKIITELLDKADLVFDEIIQAATDTLTVAEVKGQQISNYGQSAENIQTLPAAVEGMSGRVVIATAGQGAFHLKAGASDKIYLDGVALDDGDKASLATPAVGNFFSFFSFQNGASTYDWHVISGSGTLTDGGS